MFTLARWFVPANMVNRPEDDFVREEILNELHQATLVAFYKKQIAARTPNGVCIMEKRDFPIRGGAYPQGIWEFDFVRDDRWERTRFWMNPSSVEELISILKVKPEVAFDDLFAHGDAPNERPSVLRPTQNQARWGK